jgi:hypothetical protein
MIFRTPYRTPFQTPAQASFYTPDLPSTAFYAHFNPLSQVMERMASYRSPTLPGIPGIVRPGVISSGRMPAEPIPPPIPMDEAAAPESIDGYFGSPWGRRPRPAPRLSPMQRGVLKARLRARRASQKAALGYAFGADDEAVVEAQTQAVEAQMAPAQEAPVEAPGPTAPPEAMAAMSRRTGGNGGVPYSAPFPYRTMRTGMMPDVRESAAGIRAGVTNAPRTVRSLMPVAYPWASKPAGGYRGY